MDIRTIMIALMVVMCIIVVEYQEKKPADLKSIALIKPSEVLKQIFYDESVVAPKDNKPSSTELKSSVEVKPVKMVSRGLPRGIDNSFKSYMGYKSITSKSSDQWKLQQLCTTDSQGFRRYENEFYVVAMGHYYSHKVGAKFLVTFDTGKQIKVIVGDVKMRQHTNDTFQYVESNGNMLEFIVNSKKISKLIKDTGDVSNCESGELKGKIVSIEEIIEGDK